MIRLWDSGKEAPVTYERPPGGRLALLAAVRSRSAVLNLEDVRCVVTADVLAGVLSRLEVAVEQLPARAETPADIAVASRETAPSKDHRPAARRYLEIADCWLDTDAEGDCAGQFAAPEITSAHRYYALTAHYRARWIYTQAGLAGARCALDTLQARLTSLAAGGDDAPTPRSEQARELANRFWAALADDLDTPTALTVLWQVAHADLPAAERRALLLDFDSALGLELAAAEPTGGHLPEGAQELIEARDAARSEKNWARSDELRNKLAALRVESRDGPAGSDYQWRRQRPMAPD